jgi:hypothetical protein
MCRLVKTLRDLPTIYGWRSAARKACFANACLAPLFDGLKQRKSIPSSSAVNKYYLLKDIFNV